MASKTCIVRKTLIKGLRRGTNCHLPAWLQTWPSCTRPKCSEFLEHGTLDVNKEVFESVQEAGDKHSCQRSNEVALFLCVVHMLFPSHSAFSETSVAVGFYENPVCVKMDSPLCSGWGNLRRRKKVTEKIQLQVQHRIPNHRATLSSFCIIIIFFYLSHISKHSLQDITSVILRKRSGLFNRGIKWPSFCLKFCLLTNQHVKDSSCLSVCAFYSPFGTCRCASLAQRRRRRSRRAGTSLPTLKKVEEEEEGGGESPGGVSSGRQRSRNSCKQ